MSQVAYLIVSDLEEDQLAATEGIEEFESHRSDHSAEEAV